MSFDYTINTKRALLWQHEEREELRTFIELLDAKTDEIHRQFWEAWEVDVFNLWTANKFGCQVWARILDIPIIFDNTTTGESYYGFADDSLNFDNGGFAPEDPEGALSLVEARFILKIRAFSLYTNCNQQTTNEFLAQLWDELGTEVYVQNNKDMTQTINFRTEPTAGLRYMIENYEIIPCPAGVLQGIQVQGIQAWGYAEDDYNYDNGSYGV